MGDLGEWIRVPDDGPPNPKPPLNTDVWVHDGFYEGVTVGRWDGYGFSTIDHKDDVDVTHWRPMVKPGIPTRWSTKGGNPDEPERLTRDAER